MIKFAVILISLISTVVTESCYYQRCINCHPQETDIYKGVIRDCHPSNWVSPEWLHELGHPPPSTDSKIPIEFRCLKMVATPDDRSYGNTVDVLKGCIPKLQVDSVCHGLRAVERARGHSNARCYICNHNDCNSSIKEKLSFVALLMTMILYFVLR